MGRHPFAEPTYLNREIRTCNEIQIKGRNRLRRLLGVRTANVCNHKCAEPDLGRLSACDKIRSKIVALDLLYRGREDTRKFLSRHFE
jgi:hypothetical protein